MKKLVVLSLLALSTLCMGMTWTQVTPTDSKGCAGYTPSDYDSPGGTVIVHLPPSSNTYDDHDRDSGYQGYKSTPYETGGDTRGWGKDDNDPHYDD